MTAPRPRRTAPDDIVDAWLVLPERSRSRLCVNLRQGDDGERFVSIVREIRNNDRTDWYARRSLSLHLPELKGIVEILDRFREETGA